MNMDRTNIDQAKVPTIAFTLPRGLILEIDGETTVLNRAVLREMEGEEEDIIATDSLSFTETVHSLVGNCLLSLSDGNGKEITEKRALRRAINGLLMSDLLVCFLRLRQVTVGSEVRQHVTCPECTGDGGKPFKWTAVLDLSEFEGIPVEGDPKSPIREYKTSRGNRVTWEMMNGEMELSFSKAKRPKEKATAALMVRLRTWNDKPVDKDMAKRISFIERSEIRKQFDQEGGIETDFPCICPNCGHEFESKLEIGGVNFFSLLETSED